MSSVNSTKCDVCNEVTANDQYNLPRTWVTVEVKGGGSPWSTRELEHACSKECAARLFYKLADKSGGIPAPDPGNLLLSSKAYR